MKRIREHASDIITSFREVVDDEDSLSLRALCLLMIKLCAVISCGLFLFFSVGIAAGFGHEITPLKLLGAAFILILWPLVMGSLLGSAIFLHGRWRRFARRSHWRKNQPNKKSWRTNRP